MIPLTRSMGLVLEEFYNTMRTVGVSSVTGEGIGDLLDAIKEAKEEYFTVFLDSIRKKREEKTKEESKRQNEMMKKVKEDVISLSRLMMKRKHRLLLNLSISKKIKKILKKHWINYQMKLFNKSKIENMTMI